MEPTAAGPNTIRFGLFEADLASGELRKRGRIVQLQDQPFQVLALLLRHPGEIVTREELQHALWPADTFVEFEQGLNTAVKRLRLALGDSADNPRFIETLPRKGYRFIAPVEDLATRAPIPVSAPIPAPSRAWLWWGALGLVTTAILVTGLRPVPAPRARTTQLTHGGVSMNGTLAMHGGRILYVSWVEALDPVAAGFQGEFRSISTQGGEPRRERMPFLNAEPAALTQPNPGQDTIFIETGATDAAPGELWLAGFDGSKPRRIGEAAAGSGYSVSPDLKTLLRTSKEGVFARPVDGGPERLLARSEWKGFGATIWHPSGDRILLNPIEDVPKFWEVKSDGTGLRPLLPEFQAEQTCPTWSPDGKRLYFSSQGEIFVLGSRRWLGWMRRPEPQRLTAGSVVYNLWAYEDPADSRVIYTQGVVLLCYKRDIL